MISCGLRRYVRSIAANRDSVRASDAGKSLVCPEMLDVFDGVIERGYVQTAAANRVLASL